MSERYYVEWTIFPRNPWVVMDSETRAGVKAPSGRGFLHYATMEEAVRRADKLNRQRRPNV